MVDYSNPSNKSYTLAQNLCCNFNLVLEYQSKHLLTAAHQKAILIRFVKFESTSRHTSSNKKKYYTDNYRVKIETFLVSSSTTNHSLIVLVGLFLCKNIFGSHWIFILSGSEHKVSDLLVHILVRKIKN